MCGPLFLTVASVSLLSVGACLGFVTAALFAAGAEPANFVKLVVSMSDDTAEVVWQAAASLYTLGACLREGKDPFGAMADASRAAPRRRSVSSPATLTETGQRTQDLGPRSHMTTEFLGSTDPPFFYSSGESRSGAPVRAPHEAV
jgi:hypothetical protein